MTTENKKNNRLIAIASTIVDMIEISSVVVTISLFVPFDTDLKIVILSGIVTLLIVSSIRRNCVLYNGPNTEWCIIWWQKISKSKTISAFAVALILAIIALSSNSGALHTYFCTFVGAILLFSCALAHAILSYHLQFSDAGKIIYANVSSSAQNSMAITCTDQSSNFGDIRKYIINCK